MSVKTDLERKLHLDGKVMIPSTSKSQMEAMLSLETKYNLTKKIIAGDGLGYDIEYTKVKNV